MGPDCNLNNVGTWRGVGAVVVPKFSASLSGTAH